MAEPDSGSLKIKRRLPDSLRLGSDSDDEKEEKRQKINVDNLKCSICLNIWHDVVSLTPCQHNFCNGCFSEWFKRSRGQGSCKCPQCRVDVLFAGRNHAMRSVVEDMLTNDPSVKRPAAEVEKLDKSALINSNFVDLRTLSASGMPNNPPVTPPRRSAVSHPAPVSRRYVPTAHHTPTQNEDDTEHEEEDDEDEEEDEETEEDRAFINDDSIPIEANDDDEEEYRDDEEDDENEQGNAVACEQCTSNNTSYTCPPDAVHLTCTGCKRPMPERNDISVTQACEACKLPYCDVYRRSQNLGGCTVRLQPVGERQLAGLPLTTHKSNRVEQKFTKEYIDQHGLTIQGVVKDWIAKVDSNEIALANVQLTSTSLVCDNCANEAIAELVDKFRRSIPKTELPPAVARRSDCWYGHACRTQVHKLGHAEKFNHICDPTSASTQL